MGRAEKLPFVNGNRGGARADAGPSGSRESPAKASPSPSGPSPPRPHLGSPTKMGSGGSPAQNRGDRGVSLPTPPSSLPTYYRGAAGGHASPSSSTGMGAHHHGHHHAHHQAGKSSSSSSSSSSVPAHHRGMHHRGGHRQEKSTNLRKAKTKMDEEKTLERQRRVSALLRKPEERTREDVLLLEDCLLGVKFFQLSDRDTRLELCRAVQYESFDPGYHVFREGDKGEKFYIILKGAVSVRHRDPMRQVDVTIATLQEGHSFGELALLKGESNQRTASVLCTDRSEFLVLHRADYNRILNSMINKDIAEKVKFLRNVKTGAFRDLTTERLESLSGVLNLRRYPKNGILVRQGDDADELFFIKRGECRIVKEMEMCPRLLQELAMVSSRCPSALAEAMRSSSSYERESNHYDGGGVAGDIHGSPGHHHHGGKARGGPQLHAMHPLRTVLNDYFKQCVPYRIEHNSDSGLVSLVENRSPSSSSNGSPMATASSSSADASPLSAPAADRPGGGADEQPAPSSASTPANRTLFFSHSKEARMRYGMRKEADMSEKRIEDLEKEMMEMQRAESRSTNAKSGAAAAGKAGANGMAENGRYGGKAGRRAGGAKRHRSKQNRFGGGANSGFDRLLSPRKLPSLASPSARASNATKPIRVFLEVGLLGANDIFGEMGVTIKSKRACSVIANCAVEVFVLNKWDLQRRLHDSVLLRILGKVSTYQSDEEIQKEFISTLRWMEFKQSLIKDVMGHSHSRS